MKIKDAFNNNYIEYESRGGKDKNLSLEDYLDIIRTYLRDMINNYKTTNGIIIEDNISGEWKIQLTMQIDFVSLDTREIRTMDSKSDNVEFMISIETDDIINELFESFFKRY